MNLDSLKKLKTKVIDVCGRRGKRNFIIFGAVMLTVIAVAVNLVIFNSDKNDGFDYDQSAGMNTDGAGNKNPDGDASKPDIFQYQNLYQNLIKFFRRYFLVVLFLIPYGLQSLLAFL